MSIEGVRNDSTAIFAAQHAGDTVAHGTFMGHTVKVETSPLTLLADAAEELGFAVDRTKEYEISRRKEREASHVDLELLKLYQAYFRTSEKGEKLDALIESLKKRSDQESFRKSLNETFPDAADARAALEEARLSFENDPSVTDTQRSELARFIQTFEQENASTISLGMRGALTGRDFLHVDNVDALKGLYVETVGEFSDVGEVFSSIQSRYGERFDEAMDFLFAAISADIASEVPSMGRTHLEAVHQKLGEVRLTQSAFRIFEEVLHRWTSVHQEVTNFTPMSLLGEVVALRDRAYLSPLQIEGIVQKVAPRDIEHEVLFLQEFFRGMRNLPTGFFPDAHHRETFLDTVQKTLDDAIEREDEWLASLE